MQMYNETRRKTSSVRLFLQRKRLMRDGFWEGMYYKKRRVSITGRQGHCLNLLIIKYQLTVKNRKTAFQPTLSTINNQFLQF